MLARSQARMEMVRYSDLSPLRQAPAQHRVGTAARRGEHTRAREEHNQPPWGGRLQCSGDKGCSPSQQQTPLAFNLPALTRAA